MCRLKIKTTDYFMRTIQVFSLAIAILFSFQSSAQEVTTWTLQECIDYAYSQNLDVKLADLNMQTEEAYLRQSKYSRLPTLNLDLYQSWRWGRSIDPTTNQFVSQRFSSNGFSGSSDVILFSGMSQTNSIKQGEKSVEASLYDLEKAKNDVALNVVGGYLEVIFTKELLENAQYQLASTNAQLERTRLLVEAGSLPRSDLLDLQAQVASNEVNVINAQNDVDLAHLRLKQFLQIPATEPFEVVVPEFEGLELAFIEESVNEVYDRAEMTMPGIKSADARIKIAELGEKIARAGMFPTLGVGASISTNYSNTADIERKVPTGDTTQSEVITGYVNNDPSLPVYSIFNTPVMGMTDGYPIIDQWSDNINYSIGFSLRIPIFNGLQVNTNRQIAKIQHERAEIAARQARNVLRTTIESAYNDAIAASKTYSAAEKQVDALEEAFRATEKRYENNASTYVEYQVASNNLYGARSDLSRAKFNYIFTLKVLDFYLGNPITLE